MNEFIKINPKAGYIEGNLKFLEFKDSNQVIIYFPSLELSAYGSDQKEARKMGELVIKDYGNSLIQLPEAKASQELAKYGWRRSKLLKKVFNNKVFIDIKGILKNFDLPEETPVEENFLAV